MFLDDSMEAEFNDYSVSAEPLKLNWDIDISKIWIPADLLANRKQTRNPNENKPFIYYSLERPDDRDRFSVYSDEFPQCHGSPISSTVPPEIFHKSVNNNILQSKLLSQNITEQNRILDIGTNNENSSMYSANSNKSDDALRHSHKTCNFTNRNVDQSEKKASDSTQDAYAKESIENLTHRMAEILSEIEPLKETWQYEDILETSEAVNDSSTKDSLEELYYSDEDENQFACETEQNELVSRENKSPEKAYTCSIYNKHFYEQEKSEHFMVQSDENNSDKSFEDAVKILSEKQKCRVDNVGKQTECNELNKLEFAAHSKDSEQEFLDARVSNDFIKSNSSFMDNLNDLEQNKDNSDKTLEEIVEIPSEKQKNQVSNIFKQTQLDKLNKMESTDLAKDPEQDLPDIKVSNDFAEKVLEFPIAYKRPPLQEHTTKTKPQKEKKRTKKSKINIPLEDLFQNEEVDRFQVPEFDEFYENLVRQGKCEPCNQLTDQFPLKNSLEKQQTNDRIFTLANKEKSETPKQMISFWDSSQKVYIQSLDSEPKASATDEAKEENIEPELKSKISMDTIIVDHIPATVSRENVENFILGFGELKNLIIEQHGTFQRAKIQMNFTCDIGWIIDCLNDSQPFGTSSTELIKCYRQTHK